MDRTIEGDPQPWRCEFGQLHNPATDPDYECVWCEVVRLRAENVRLEDEVIHVRSLLQQAQRDFKISPDTT